MRSRSFPLAVILLLVVAIPLWPRTGADLIAPRPSQAQAAPAGAVAQRAALHPPPILAKSAYLLDVASGEALFQKFPHTRRPMASATKIMTGLLAAESGRLDEMATVSRRAAAIGETTMGLVEGERVMVGELLFGLLMNSGNDAAVALAEHLAGSEQAFVAAMNARAAQLGLANTRFANPHGLDHGSYYSPAHYSTAHDLALLMAAAMANPTFARAAGTMRRTVAGPPGRPAHVLRHTLSALWWYPGVMGGKTGWTGRAGQVRVAAAQRGPTHLVAVVMDSPDHVGELRDLLDFGFALNGRGEAQGSVPLSAEAFPPADARLAQAWAAYKQLALAPDGRIRTGADGAEGSAGAQAAALLHAVWFRDRAAFDRIWTWTSQALTRRQGPPRDALFAGRWAHGAVVDWNNATGADQRIAAALLLASRLWNEPAYAREAGPILEAVLNKAAISWRGGLGIAAANTFLKELEPVTTSAADLTPAFYRMFAEASRNATWLSLLDGTYASLEQAASPDGPLGSGAGLIPSWFAVSRQGGRVAPPVDPSWQSTGFADASPALVWQLGLDLLWNGDERAARLLGPTARLLGGEMVQRQRIARAYIRTGLPATGAETAAYGALAALALPGLEPHAEPAFRARLQAALDARDPQRILDGIDGLWLLAGGPPNFWRIWWPPDDLPTTRNDGVVPPEDDRPWRYFPETGHVVQGAFLEYFQANGGVETFGLPRTDELVEDGRSVQYFQRARMEYVATADGAEIVLAPLGAWAAAARGVLARPEAAPVAPFESTDQRLYVPETGHSIQLGFKRFYEGHGGAAVLGLPLTEEFDEDGFTVQYFERARLEYLPGRPVQAGLLGDDLLRTKGWLK